MEKTPVSDQTASRLAQSLIRAHQSGKRIAVDDDARALTRDQAKHVMFDVAMGLGQTPTGWKVAVIDGTPAYAPMLEKDIQPSGAHVPMIEEGYLIEVEVALRLGHDLPHRATPYSRSEIEAACAEWVVGVELIGSRLKNSPGEAPFPAWLADNMGNALYVTGPAVPFSAIKDGSTLPLIWWLDGEVKEDKIGGHPQNDPILPILLNANAPDDLFGGFKKGQLITTGSLTKPTLITGKGRIEAEIKGIGRVSLSVG
jgi:2-keto-4-pentenoate hydratase